MKHMIEKRTREIPTPDEVVRYKDGKLLAEKEMPNLTKIDLAGHEQKTLIRTLQDSHNELIKYVHSLERIVKSSQEYLIEIKVQLDELQKNNSRPTKPSNKKLSEEEKKEIWRQNGIRIGQKRSNALAVKVKEYRLKNPKASITEISKATKVTIETVVKYIDQGLA